MEIELEETAEIDSLPVFPLPTAVLFPGIVLPLHIEEPCYCELIADALKENGVLAVVMVQEGQDGGAPPLCDVAGAGKIIHAEKLEAGDYNVLIQGLDRVRLLEELPGARGYRRFKAEIIPKPTEDEADLARDEIVKLESCVMNLVSTIADSDAQLVEVMRATPDPVQLADFLSATVVQDIAVQQEILETLDLKVRLARLIDVLVELLGQSSAAPARPEALN